MAAPEDTAMILPRTGIGVDVHAYAPENDPQPLWLGGLFWAGNADLQGIPTAIASPMQPLMRSSPLAASVIWARISERTVPNSRVRPG